MSIQSAHVRPPAVAGQFYPEAPSELRLLVEDLLGRAPDAQIPGRIAGIIAPHAGYPYSGETAATAYRQVRDGHYDTVVLIAPSHGGCDVAASVFPGDGYETPLGVARIDREVAAALARENGDIQLSMSGHAVTGSGDPLGGLRGEHAAEVQLPFLQIALPDVPIVPVVMAGRSLEAAESLADAVVEATRGKSVLLVASSDLYHGHSYDECLSTDGHTLRRIQDMDPGRFAAELSLRKVQACGGGPIAALICVARRTGATEAHVLRSTNSNDVMGQRGGYVVGYSAVLIHAPADTQSSEEGLSDDDRSVLARIAREAVLCAVRGDVPPAAPVDTPTLGELRGAFVTLQSHGTLRGCIGDIHGHDPLAATVQNMATAAALRDPRFPPVTESEVDALEIDISVLSPMRKADAPAEVEVGRHGVWIRKGFQQGVLLPQVPVEHGWSRNEFLDHACLKAGLRPEAWHEPDTEIWIFSADVFQA